MVMGVFQEDVLILFPRLTGNMSNIALVSFKFFILNSVNLTFLPVHAGCPATRVTESFGGEVDELCFCDGEVDGKVDGETDVPSRYPSRWMLSQLFIADE